MINMKNKAGAIKVVPVSMQKYYEGLGWKLQAKPKAQTKEEKAEDKQPDYLTKPIAKWSNAEIKEYCETNKISLEGLSPAQAKAKVKEHLEEK